MRRFLLTLILLLGLAEDAAAGFDWNNPKDQGGVLTIVILIALYILGCIGHPRYRDGGGGGGCESSG